MKTLLSSLSVLAIVVATPVLAQTSSPSMNNSSGSSANSTMASPSAQQLSDTMRVSKLLNTTVRNDANESVGSINDVLIDKSGKVAAVIVGVGGFLGIGERNVAMSFDQVHVHNDNGTLVATASVTKDQLRQVPEWRDPNASSNSSTSSGSSGTAGTGTSSSTNK